ncbi:hypothetical protein [Pseudomonas sp. HS-18]|uniref:hypothetical protein n=1 Tax=Pseudomonas sp. HS-18 TaxID=2879114 RepID=UPI001CEFE020|nr:hypothetical protein [Pseudomonas sp. HS-18]UCL84517.1 hypothetical protein LDJ84_16190 [Pseudomonas sp. HS-18]
MLFDPEKLSPETRRRIQGLMLANGWSFEKALNEICISAVSNGATSVVGRKKAKVLQLVPLNRDSDRASKG